MPPAPQPNPPSPNKKRQAASNALQRLSLGRNQSTVTKGLIMPSSMSDDRYAPNLGYNMADGGFASRAQRTNDKFGLSTLQAPYRSADQSVDHPFSDGTEYAADYSPSRRGSIKQGWGESIRKGFDQWAHQFEMRIVFEVR